MSFLLFKVLYREKKRLRTFIFEQESYRSENLIYISMQNGSKEGEKYNSIDKEVPMTPVLVSALPV